MSESRLFVDGPLAAGSETRLQGDRARYAGRVLRLQKGNALTLFDGSGIEFAAVVVAVGKNEIVVAVNEATERDTESPLNIHLLQGVSRGDRMDLVVQKATELGVAKITPLLTRYSIVKLSGTRALKRVRHWQGVAASACEQCGRNRLPDIESPVPLRDWVGGHLDADSGRLILRPGAPGSIRDLEAGTGPVAVMIGPEGGFSDEEYGLADSAGFKAIGFGPRVLRTESAAIAILAALQTLYGDLS